MSGEGVGPLCRRQSKLSVDDCFQEQKSFSKVQEKPQGPKEHNRKETRMCRWKEGLEILKGLGMNAKGGAALEAAGDTESSMD